MNDISKHGGKRTGAGRKKKWAFEYVLEIGQACEKLWSAEQQATFEQKRDKALSDELNIAQHHKEIQAIPVKKRATRLKTEGANIYFSYMAAEIEELNEMENIPNPQNRIFSFSNKPPRGTRTRIIEYISVVFGLEPKQVDNIWQQYRRLEREFRDG
jgi:hypothetical protein